MKKLIASLILVAACTKAERAAPLASDAASSDLKGVVASRAVAEAGAPQQQQQQPMPRMIVRTAQMRIVVADTSKALDAVTKQVEASGGFVADSSIWREGELLRAKLTLRVPGDKLTATLASIRGIAKRVDNESISSEDVSQEYVDLESQLRNLEATEIELRELLTAIRKNARKAAEVLEIHQQITAIRGEIERTKGRMRYLSQVTALSTISVEMMPDAILQPVVERGRWNPLVIVKDASRALVGVLQGIATATIWIAVYLLPLAAILLLFAVAIGKAYRRSRVTAA